jgi:predicted nucleotidyltransferase
MGGVLDKRRQNSSDRLAEFQKKLDSAGKIIRDKACVYVTGSFGRGEAGDYSDLDLFIVGRANEVKVEGAPEERHLGRLDEICLKAELIEATRSSEIPEFSGDGEYLAHYTIGQLVRSTGKPEDDANNTFTARLLLLLESRPLLGKNIYSEAIDDVISKYWGDYEDHKNEFVPAFLGNDIIRLWRTFCVNYEARTKKDPPEKGAKRRLKNYKLKYSRLLTCYSALLYLLSVYGRNKTVTPDDIRNMVRLSPTERLEWLTREKDLADAHAKANELLALYEGFLDQTNVSENTLLKQLEDRATRKAYFSAADAFGDTMFDLIELLGKKSRLHRLLVV